MTQSPHCHLRLSYAQMLAAATEDQTGSELANVPVCNPTRLAPSSTSETTTQSPSVNTTVLRRDVLRRDPRGSGRGGYKGRQGPYTRQRGTTIGYGINFSGKGAACQCNDKLEKSTATTAEEHGERSKPGQVIFPNTDLPSSDTKGRKLS